MKYIIFKRIIINYIIMQSESVMYLVLFGIKINFLFFIVLVYHFADHGSGLRV